MLYLLNATNILQYPLKEMIVINREEEFLNDVLSLQNYIIAEVNIRMLTVSHDKEKYGVQLKAEPNFRLLGIRLKGDQKKVVDYLKVVMYNFKRCLYFELFFV